ncbi:MAG: hypothetical protein ACF8OB_15695, partial [Phycisphaeraceae bacterium JB051]
TYVYLPASAVEKVDFKPAVAETPVTPEPVKPVVTVATPKPAPKPQPTTTAQPDFVIEKSEPIVAETITMPDPEKTVITSTPKPVVNVAVTPEPKPQPKPVVAPKPIETVAVAPVVAPKPEPKPVATPQPTPTPKTVEITEPALRPLVINKPQPGDASTSTPAATVTTVDTTPQPVVVTTTPSVTATPAPVTTTTSTVRRATPPIPDTETPPDFEGLPMHAANPNVAPAPQPVAVVTPAPQPQPEFTPSRPSAVDVSVADTSLPLNTEELVVDKPASTGDRLDATVPAKPELPVMNEASTSVATVEVPAFTAAESQPVNDGTLPAVQQPVTITPAPVAAPVATVEAAPAPAPVAQPQPAVAPKPTVNPLLATRDYFKPQSEMLVKLEDRLVEAYNEPLDQIPLDNYLNAYQQIGNLTALSIHDQRIVQARELMIKRDIQLAKALRSIGTVQRYTQPEPVAVAPTPVQAPQPTETTYEMSGQLLASALYDGQNLPRLYRLVNPAQPTVTLIYVRPSDKLNPSAYLGRTVGINGQIQVDDALNLRLMDVEEIGLQ